MKLLPLFLRRPIEAVYERRLAATLVGLPRPQHVGIMLDGNRRWARQAGHTDLREGYRAGGAKATEFLDWCTAAGIERVTLFMLSDDNLGRPAEQLGPLIEIIKETVQDITASDRPWEVQVIGSLDLLPGATAEILKEATATTAGRGGLKVDIAVGYGGRREIVDAVKSAFAAHVAAGGDPAELAERFDIDDISRHLYSPTADQTDFIIRTSGEQRLSGFLLWQSAYAEMHWVDCYWPAFRRVDFLRAIRSYAGRQRRYGK
ncbi:MULTISPECIES: isoprenyl transferase [Streptomyces]|uniref:Isoprenyl transferase n=1 Tax=Streptomyces clavifer TaxID=68188 RepID=A0ABS4VAX7_9ACTN|nr:MULTISPECIES: isoprenyl transferase [Streptomyces]KQX90628.1 farnesyl-diphosphate synthase [Streptomyces sp. Root1319]KQZ03323.1 farnesyl-diphosphate synthase [Streptomyces sp. Root55]MBP2360971.1 short-chain Z-isoprenyl diphosphate synthase [Streptomyces clavifer]MDX2745860.1 isoprenyl transferase [Streptomyces sp. NRRL_B-2557]MDX3063774.1 isoprenyl transferase [Streptomyces sp. ND04-05B]